MQNQIHVTTTPQNSRHIIHVHRRLLVREVGIECARLPDDAHHHHIRETTICIVRHESVRLFESGHPHEPGIVVNLHHHSKLEQTQAGHLGVNAAEPRELHVAKVASPLVLPGPYGATHNELIRRDLHETLIVTIDTPRGIDHLIFTFPQGGVALSRLSFRLTDQLSPGVTRARLHLGSVYRLGADCLLKICCLAKVVFDDGHHLQTFHNQDAVGGQVCREKK